MKMGLTRLASFFGIALSIIFRAQAELTEWDEHANEVGAYGNTDHTRFSSFMLHATGMGQEDLWLNPEEVWPGIYTLYPGPLNNSTAVFNLRKHDWHSGFMMFSTFDFLIEPKLVRWWYGDLIFYTISGVRNHKLHRCEECGKKFLRFLRFFNWGLKHTNNDEWHLFNWGTESEFAFCNFNKAPFADKVIDEPVLQGFPLVVFLQGFRAPEYCVKTRLNALGLAD